MAVRIKKQYGNYNLMRLDEYEWQLAIVGLPEGAPARAVTAMFDHDDEPNEDNATPPSEVVEVIAERVERPLFSTGRDRDREVIAWIRDNAESVDEDWAKGRLQSLRQQMSRLQQEIEDVSAFVGESA